jgi:O-antigen ligase
MIPLAAFFAFAAASAMWSARPFKFGDISFMELRFNIGSDVASVGLLFAAIAAMMAAAMGLNEAERKLVNVLARVALLVQLVIVSLLAAFEPEALKLFAPLMANSAEGVQNISRNSQIMAVAAPTLALLLAFKQPRVLAFALVISVTVAVVAMLVVREVFGGILALVMMALALAVVELFPKLGFRIIASFIAFIIMFAPLLFGLMVGSADAALADDSASYRAAIWKRVLEVIGEHPVFGAGVGALREINETIPSGVFAGQPLVPNHPHNMPLQLWAETGAVGAILMSAAIVMAGWRLPGPAKLGRAGWRAASIAGGFLAAACVSFDLWNEWWWAVGGFLAVLCVAHLPENGAAGPTSGGKQ